MLTILLQNSKLLERSLNLLFQLVLLIIIFVLYTDDIVHALPVGILVSHVVHYGLIALADIYEDDYPESNKKYYAYIGMLLYFLGGITFGLFENEFIRLHILIVLAGNWLGGKVDTTMWKSLFFIYFSTMIGYELLSFSLFDNGFTMLIYASFAIFMISLCERLSEKNQQAWMLHSSLFFGWALVQGAFYQEGVLFMLGGLSYEITKLSMGFATHKSKITENKLLAA
ncbi:hypothetical protein [Aureispira anguillae]|uniref:Uncharacterized protein n=1 Tax=Aureispira anguillae TaxID=2864201 RepID=A0A916DUU6_9BACT|nr:hypothetical protein [Aureispira anguillae]BDS14439.1 hypothetical protein AsAng_0052190 [Aureispira anguillae]